MADLPLSPSKITARVGCDHFFTLSRAVEAGTFKAPLPSQVPDEAAIAESKMPVADELNCVAECARRQWSNRQP